MQEETLVKVAGQKQKLIKRQILNCKVIEGFPKADYHINRTPV